MNILCPTDFSENSCFAVEYAININKALGGKITFLTTYTVPRATGSFRKFDIEIRDTVAEEMEKFIQQYESLMTGQKEPGRVVIEGSPADEILHYAKKHHFDLIIMGTQGSSDLRTALFGSVTKKVIENSVVPVLAIPSTTREFLTGNRILLSLDDDEVENKEIFNILKHILTSLKAEMDIIHVSEPDSYNPFSNQTTEYLKDITEEIIVLHHEDPIEAIKHYVEKSDIGILVMVRRKHTFWERLFINTNTTSELFSSNVPVLVLPE
ncbi:MAG: universal stress protein [Saprospiraceae bacterium]|nr:universal stress protein [Saprospiraceae bacterium]